MSRTWRRRALVVGVVWAIGVAALAQLEMRPNPVALAAIAVALTTAIWLLVDLGDLAAPASWRTLGSGGGIARGDDPRMRMFQRQLQRATEHDDAAVHDVLVALIDDRLLAHHRIDRRDDPASAGRVLGPELTAFVNHRPGATSLAGGLTPAGLSPILDRIASL